MLLPRKLSPAALSGWMGMRRRFSLETRHRNQNQRKNRKYQRSRMNWKIGTLTKAYQYPAGVRFICAASGIAYQLAVPRAIWLFQTQRPERVDQHHQRDFRDHRVAHAQGGAMAS